MLPGRPVPFVGVLIGGLACVVGCGPEFTYDFRIGGGGGAGGAAVSSATGPSGTGGGAVDASSPSVSSSSTGGCVPATETCNGADDDCDGATDELEGDCQSASPGACAAGKRACVNGMEVCSPIASPSAETCNGIDDDCNGLVDDLPHAVTGENAGLGIAITSVALGPQGKPILTVAPGQTFDAKFGYSIKDPGCCGCVDQLLVGLTDAGFQQCIYSGVPGCNAPKVGVGSAVLTAPTTPGAYPIRIDRSQDYSCPSKKTWWNMPTPIEVGIVCVVAPATP